MAQCYFFKTKNADTFRNPDGSINAVELIKRDTAETRRKVEKVYDTCIRRIAKAKDKSAESVRCLKWLSRFFYNPQEALTPIGCVSGTDAKGRRRLIYLPVSESKWIGAKKEILSAWKYNPVGKLPNKEYVHSLVGDGVFREISVTDMLNTISRCDSDYKGVMFQKKDKYGTMHYNPTLENFRRVQTNRVAVSTRRLFRKLVNEAARGYSIYAVTNPAAN